MFPSVLPNASIAAFPGRRRPGRGARSPRGKPPLPGHGVARARGPRALSSAPRASAAVGPGGAAERRSVRLRGPAAAGGLGGLDGAAGAGGGVVPLRLQEREPRAAVALRGAGGRVQRGRRRGAQRRGHRLLRRGR